MPKKKIDASNVIKYSNYFNINSPSSLKQMFTLLVIGAATGVIALLILGPHPADISTVIPEGISIGIMIVSMPAALTAIVLKISKKKLKMKHALFGAVAITAFYAASIIAAAAISSILGHPILAYIILIASNALIYGYWFFIDKVVIGDKRRAIIFGAVQPVFNILMYIPFDKYLFSVSAPIPVYLIKLYVGMLVFLGIGYFIIYVLDRPAKRQLDVSGIAIFTAMVNQWLFDVNPSANFLGDVGVLRDVSVDLLALRGRKGYKAIFVKPDVHYGPFSSVGGSITTEVIGKTISERFSATPFVMHGAVNIDDNPISTTQVYNMNRAIERYITNGLTEYKSAVGSLGIGEKGACRAINMNIGEVNLLTLTKAPMITEDIDRDVGIYLEKKAKGGTQTILVDAHNSRDESASKSELKGIYKGSRYVRDYAEAIARATGGSGRETQMRFGSAGRKIKRLLGEAKDIGGGYTSVGIFDFGRRRFAMIYIDANNMLPDFREGLIRHVKENFGIDCEVCTTDTHSVNTIALSASNTVGTDTTLTKMYPIIDALIEDAQRSVEPVKYAHGRIEIPNFKVWGVGAEEELLKVGRDGLHTLKHIVPFIIAAGFIIACWIIYIV
jgi:predicted neutral ceramidase superfamily lipid hydrolase